MATPIPAPSRLDRFLPAYDFNEVHETRVRASAADTYAALRALRPRDVPMVGVLMTIRRLPARLLGHPVPREGDNDIPILEGMGRGGFLRLDEEQGREVIVGIVGQFWKLCPEPIRLRVPGDFLEFSRPGFARAVMNFEILPEGSATSRLRTETRIQATDARSRRTFGRYWTLVHPGSALIRRVWLRAVRRRAEAGA
jgi:hypothetical protein